MKKKKDVITRKKYIACILFESIFIYVNIFLFFSTLQMNFFFTEAGRKVQNLNPNPITIKIKDVDSVNRKRKSASCGITNAKKVYTQFSFEHRTRVISLIDRVNLSTETSYFKKIVGFYTVERSTLIPIDKLAEKVPENTQSVINTLKSVQEYTFIILGKQSYLPIAQIKFMAPSLPMPYKNGDVFKLNCSAASFVEAFINSVECSVDIVYCMDINFNIRELAVFMLATIYSVGKTTIDTWMEKEKVDYDETMDLSQMLENIDDKSLLLQHEKNVFLKDFIVTKVSFNEFKYSYSIYRYYYLYNLIYIYPLIFILKNALFFFYRFTKVV